MHITTFYIYNGTDFCLTAPKITVWADCNYCIQQALHNHLEILDYLYYLAIHSSFLQLLVILVASTAFSTVSSHTGTIIQIW